MVYIQTVKVRTSYDLFTLQDRDVGASVGVCRTLRHGTMLAVWVMNLSIEVQEQLTSLERMVEADIIAANHSKSISNSNFIYLSSSQMFGVLCQVSSRYRFRISKRR